MRFFSKKTVSLVLALLVVLSCGAAIVSASGNDPVYSDVPENYWGYEAITKWSTDAYNILVGDGKGHFYPNDPITAEQLAWLNGNILGIAEADAKFDGDGKRELTRAEAVAIIAKAFCIEPLDNAKDTFADNASIPAEYRGYVNAMKAAGYVAGVGNNTFAPDTTYTRASALQIVYNMISDITDKDVSNVKAPESYVIRKAGVQLKDATIDGNLIIGNGVGNGEATLENVTVKGKLVVFGGGSNSIIVRGKSNIPTVDIYKTTGEAARIKVEGEAVVQTVTVAESSKAIINGAITNLVVDGNNSVELQGATVVSVKISGDSVSLNVDANSAVKEVTVDASNVKTTGTGKVESAVITDNAKSGVVVDTKGTKIDVADNAGDVTDSSGSVVMESGESGTTPGSSTTNPPVDNPTPGSGRA